MIIIGLVCLLIGWLLGISILWIVGIILLVIGLILMALTLGPSPRMGRRYW
jgi:hypothetical protein